jgi:hypothetical protein
MKICSSVPLRDGAPDVGGLGALEHPTATLRMAAANRRTNLGKTQSRIIGLTGWHLIKSRIEMQLDLTLDGGRPIIAAGPSLGDPVGERGRATEESREAEQDRRNRFLPPRQDGVQ